MTPHRAITLLACAAAVPLIAFAVTGCGNSGSTASSGPPKNTNTRRPTVNSSTNKLGEVLVDSKGETLYLFAQDKGPRTTCFDSCARAWPPLTTKSKPTAGGNVKASMLSTSKRPDGPPQVTYNGHPLYLYQNDLKPGDVTGQGIDVWGDVWWAVSPSGKKVTKGGRKKPGAGY
jgi:predicted lipoprotein with Yx(FWY)xxD motif